MTRTVLVVVSASAALAALLPACAPSIGEGWTREGYTRMEPRPPVPVGGNYFIEPRVYSGDRLKPRNVLRLLHKAKDADTPVEIRFPDTYSVHPELNPRFISPNGDRMMVPGTPVFARGRPVLLDFVVGSRPIAHFQRDPDADRKQEFHLHAATPMWASNNNWFALEAVERDAAGASWDVLLFHYLGGNKMEVITIEGVLGAGSYHFGGWSPTGKKLLVFEGFPAEEYSTGPVEVYHRLIDGRTQAPITRGVKLWEIQLYPEFKTRVIATRVGGWLKTGKFDPKANFFFYSWTEDEKVVFEPGAKVEGG